MKMLDELEQKARAGQVTPTEMLNVIAAYRDDLIVMKATEADLAGIHRRVATLERALDHYGDWSQHHDAIRRVLDEGKR